MAPTDRVRRKQPEGSREEEGNGEKEKLLKQERYGEGKEGRGEGSEKGKL